MLKRKVYNNDDIIICKQDMKSLSLLAGTTVVVFLCICILLVLRPFLVFRFDKMGTREI